MCVWGGGGGGGLGGWKGAGGGRVAEFLFCMKKYFMLSFSQRLMKAFNSRSILNILFLNTCINKAFLKKKKKKKKEKKKTRNFLMAMS